MRSDSVVRARIDSTTKREASTALHAMGLSISDAIRLTLTRIAQEKRLPFEVKVSVAAAEETAGKSERGKRNCRLDK